MTRRVYTGPWDKIHTQLPVGAWGGHVTHKAAIYSVTTGDVTDHAPEDYTTIRAKAGADHTQDLSITYRYTEPREVTDGVDTLITKTFGKPDKTSFNILALYFKEMTVIMLSTKDKDTQDVPADMQDFADKFALQPIESDDLIAKFHDMKQRNTHMRQQRLNRNIIYNQRRLKPTLPA